MMKIINAKLREQSGLYTLLLKEGKIAQITPQEGSVMSDDSCIDAKEKLVIPPFVEPHIHLDAALTAGVPQWNQSGTLFEGIDLWSKRKKLVTPEDTKVRALETIRMLAGYGVQHVRSHVDVTEPNLSTLKAMLEVRESCRDLVDLQIVAFPQEGIESFPHGRELMQEAVAMGVDVVGGIPHFENTREQGVSSIKFLMDLAEKNDCLVDVHCDETDDPHSRFLEVLAEETRIRGMGDKVTASHTTAMGSYDNAYCYKLFKLLKEANLNFISCPTESIHLQGRFDSYPRRRGLTRIDQIDEAGLNICFAQDSIHDPWYPLGNGNILRMLDYALHIGHLLGYKTLQNCLRFITDNGAKTLNLQDNYGIAVGRPANLLILSESDDVSMLRQYGHVTHSIRQGKIIMQRSVSEVKFF